MSFFRLFSIFLLYMTLGHALVANTFSVNEDSELSEDLSSSNPTALNFVVNIPPYIQGDADKSPRYQNFSLQSNGSFTLEAEANWNGTLVFEWNATDSTNNTIINGTATVTVDSENDDPQRHDGNQERRDSGGNEAFRHRHRADANAEKRDTHRGSATELTSGDTQRSHTAEHDQAEAKNPGSD